MTCYHNAAVSVVNHQLKGKRGLERGGVGVGGGCGGGGGGRKHVRNMIDTEIRFHI